MPFHTATSTVLPQNWLQVRMISNFGFPKIKLEPKPVQSRSENFRRNYESWFLKLRIMQQFSFSLNWNKNKQVRLQHVRRVHLQPLPSGLRLTGSLTAGNRTKTLLLFLLALRLETSYLTVQMRTCSVVTSTYADSIQKFIGLKTVPVVL